MEKIFIMTTKALALVITGDQVEHAYYLGKSECMRDALSGMVN